MKHIARKAQERSYCGESRSVQFVFEKIDETHVVVSAGFDTRSNLFPMRVKHEEICSRCLLIVQVMQANNLTSPHKARMLLKGTA